MLYRAFKGGVECLPVRRLLWAYRALWRVLEQDKQERISAYYRAQGARIVCVRFFLGVRVSEPMP